MKLLLRGLFFGFVIISSALMTSSATAQLFRPVRQLGRPFEPRQGTLIGQQDTGVVQGSERFIRDNRDRSDFVGADRQEQAGFVGSEQAIGRGRVRTAVESLTPPPDRSSEINRPLTPPTTSQLPYPRLVLDFPPPSRPTTDADLSALLERMQRAIGDARSLPIEVSVEAQTAILRGEVPSVREKDLLEILASFEPGIYEVRNELRVQSPQN